MYEENKSPLDNANLQAIILIIIGTLVVVVGGIILGHVFEAAFGTILLYIGYYFGNKKSNVK